MKVFFLTYLLTIVSLPVYAAETITLNWGFVRLPPLAYINENNEADGDFTDMLVSIGQEANIKFVPSEFPNARALFNINAKKVNFAIGVHSMIKNKEDFVFSDAPFAKLNLMVVWRTGTEPVLNYEQLQKHEVILIQAYTYNGHRNKIEKSAANVVNVESHQRAIDALLKGRADYALVYKLATEFALDDDFYKNGKSLTGRVIDEYPLYFILDADFPNAHGVMNKIEVAFQSIF